MNADLTHREEQILTFIAYGFSSEAIAQELYVSRRTIEWHLENLYDKFQVHNRATAIKKGLALGILKEEGLRW